MPRLLARSLALVAKVTTCWICMLRMQMAERYIHKHRVHHVLRTLLVFLQPSEMLAHF